jgi:hypothetical protein
VTEERLSVLSLSALLEIAGNEGIKNAADLNREDLIEQILEAIEEDREERECFNNFAMRIEEKKYEILLDEEFESQKGIVFEIPERYNETKIALLLRDPFWAFAYWGIQDQELEEIEERGHLEGLLLRVCQLETDESGKEGVIDSFDIPVKVQDNKWYINLPESGKSYFIKLIARLAGGEKVLCTSNSVTSPEKTVAATIAGENITDFSDPMLAFAGLFHLSESSFDGSIPHRIIQFIEANNFNFK